ncbi:MAG: 50S ribosomal protein L29 [Bacilli bacterium]|nr:50S ribosomal protein L29 [Bacilli bacterium]
MDAKEFREMTPEELSKKIYDLKAELFELRRKKAVGGLENPNQIHSLRKDLAKAETVRRERELAAK